MLDWMQSLSPWLESPALVVGLAAALAVLALAAAIRGFVGGRDLVSARLLRARTGGEAGRSRLLLDKGIARALRPSGELEADTDASAQGARRLLVHAGLRGRRSLQIFLMTKGVLSALGAIAVLLVNARSVDPAPLALPLALVAAGLGFFAPNVWIYSRISKRQRALRSGLPDAMDLLVTCVEAGLGLDGALARVTAEIQLASPLLADELKTTSLEAQAGMARAEAFRRLAARTGVDELRALAATLSQTEVFGTSVAAALRNQAEWIRNRRMQRAEERAATVAVKMTIPLVLCILPSLIAVILGPAVVNIVDNLFGYWK